MKQVTYNMWVGCGVKNSHHYVDGVAFEKLSKIRSDINAKKPETFGITQALGNLWKTQ